MKHNKLILSTALTTSMLFGAVANAEIKGDVTNTFTMGSVDGASNATKSETRFGSEINLKYKNKVDLDNGMYASVKGKVELDNSDGAGADNDNEYEVQIGSGNFYIGAGSDSGNNISSTVLPIIGYTAGTLAQQSGTTDSAQGDFIGGDEANEYQHVSANFKAAGGTFSMVYAPNETSNANDTDTLASDGTAGGSVTSVLYKGKPMDGLSLMVGRNTENNDSNSADAGETDTDRLGVAYNFGQFAVGFDRTTSENGDNTIDKEADRFAVSFAASDAVTIGVQHQVVENNSTGTNSGDNHDEEATTFDVGYNLGGMTVLAQYVQAEGVGAATASSSDIVESEALVITTKMKF